MPWRPIHAELDVLVAAPAWGPSDRDMHLVEISLTSTAGSAGVGL